MPGQVPLSNAQFINSPDFNNQAIEGITGPGVFRQFNYLNTGTNIRTISASDVWTVIDLSGNSLVTVPAGISANVGDEILFVNPTGTISFDDSVVNNNYLSVVAGRPARLIYAGANYWTLAGAKFGRTDHFPTDCCGNSMNGFYTMQSGAFTESYIAYSSSSFLTLYTSTAVGGVVVVGGTGYTITSGNATANPCTYVSFTYAYTFYDGFGNASTFYSYQDVDIYNPSVIIGLPFRTTSTAEAYPCDISIINGTYYRSYNEYGAANPVCFSNGIIISAEACP